MPYDIIVGRDASDLKKFGKKGLVYLGRGYVKMGQYTSLSNPIYMDVARSHVVLVAGKRGCLEGDTLVFTDKGYKTIKDFNQKNDKILSFDKNKKEFEWENAELLKYPISKENLLKIEFEDGRSITLTKEHPLLAISSVNRSKLLTLMWMKAEDFNVGDKTLSIGESFDDLIPLSITKIEKVDNIKEVYDLSVDKNHSFIANGIISHNSGKSYTLGVVAEEISCLPEEVKENIASIIFDTMGIYWTMKYPNDKEKELLAESGMKPKKTPSNVIIPYGFVEDYEKRGILFDETFALNPADIKIEDWLLTFSLRLTEPVGVIIERTLGKLQEKGRFDIDDIIESIRKDEETEQEVKNAAIGLFEAAKEWKIFASKEQKATETKDLVKAGVTTILDISMYSSIGTFNVRALVVGLVIRKIFTERMLARKAEEIQAVEHGFEYLTFKTKREMPLVWFFIDEMHEFLPHDYKTSATDAIVQLLREGRQPGLSLAMATQQPGGLRRDALTQSDIVISHRVTAQPDVESLNYIMQSYLSGSIKRYLDELPTLKGSALILDDNSERIYPMRMRPRFTWHGGESPVAIKVEKKL